MCTGRSPPRTSTPYSPVCSVTNLSLCMGDSVDVRMDVGDRYRHDDLRCPSMHLKSKIGKILLGLLNLHLLHLLLVVLVLVLIFVLILRHGLLCGMQSSVFRSEWFEW